MLNPHDFLLEKSLKEQFYDEMKRVIWKNPRYDYDGVEKVTPVTSKPHVVKHVTSKPHVVKHVTSK